MNKTLKIFLGILGAFDVLLYIATPMVLALLYITIFGIKSFGSYLIYGIALASMIFRGIKIGWLK